MPRESLALAVGDIDGVVLMAWWTQFKRGWTVLVFFLIF